MAGGQRAYQRDCDLCALMARNMPSTSRLRNMMVSERRCVCTADGRMSNTLLKRRKSSVVSSAQAAGQCRPCFWQVDT